MIASRAAYSGGEDWLNSASSTSTATTTGEVVHQSQHPDDQDLGQAEGTYLIWLDVSQVAEKISAKDKAAAESKAGQGPRRPSRSSSAGSSRTPASAEPRHTYGAGGTNHMRMNIAPSRKTLQAALTSMANALKGPALSTAAL